MIRAIALVAVAILFADSPTPAGAAACVGRKGNLTSRAACKKSERPLDATSVSTVGPTGQAGAPGKQGDFPLVILDAGDHEVGTILSLDFGTALVTLTHPAFPSPVRFVVFSGGFTNLVADAYGIVMYAEAGCSGQPYLPVVLGAYAHVEGSAAYLASGSAASIAVMSYETDDLGSSCPVIDMTGRGTCCIAATFNVMLVPGVRLALPDFTPPFRTVLR